MLSEKKKKKKRFLDALIYISTLYIQESKKGKKQKTNQKKLIQASYDFFFSFLGRVLHISTVDNSDYVGIPVLGFWNQMRITRFLKTSPPPPKRKGFSILWLIFLSRMGVYISVVNDQLSRYLTLS